MGSGSAETWSLLSAIPLRSASVRPHEYPLPLSASFLGPPSSAAPACLWVCQLVSDPLPLPHAALGCGAEFWDSCSFPPTTPQSSRPRLSVGQFVCLLAPPLWVFPAGVMEPVAMATASVYRTHRSQSPLTPSLSLTSLTQQRSALKQTRDLVPTASSPWASLPPPFWASPHQVSSPLPIFPPLPSHFPLCLVSPLVCLSLWPGFTPALSVSISHPSS